MKAVLGILAIATSVMAGCSSTCVVAHPDGDAANAIHSEGVVYGDRYTVAQPDPGQVQSPGLHDVTVKDNWFYDLIGVVTLGIYSPHDVSYRNVKPMADDGGEMSPASRPGGH